MYGLIDYFHVNKGVIGAHRKQHILLIDNIVFGYIAVLFSAETHYLGLYSLSGKTS